MSTWSRRRLLTGVTIGALTEKVATGPRAAEVDVRMIAAAADLSYVLKEVADNFTKEAGKSVKLVFGSSGNFTTQIRNGAPFQVFLCADEEYVQALTKEGLTENDGTLYAVGRIGLFAVKGGPLTVDPEMKGLAAALAAGKIEKFAIANPEQAPYGRAAEAALRHAGLWEMIQPKLVLGENVAQATQFAISGSAQGGIIPLSLAKSAPVIAAGSFALIPADWHPPMRQRMVLLENAGPMAHAFYDYVQGPAARALFRRYGFMLPGETPTVTN
jgi:molybdate transport system substrate-binding protein